jgi:hypothetical protein
VLSGVGRTGLGRLLAVFVAAGTVLVPTTVDVGVEVGVGSGVSVGPTVLGTTTVGTGAGTTTAVAVGMARTVGTVRTLLGCVGSIVGFGVGFCNGADGVGFTVVGVDSVGGVVVSNSSIGMGVDMTVGSINSGSVGVFVDVGEGSGVVVIWGVVVVDGEAVEGGGLVGVGSGVTEAEGEGVGVRHVPGVARVRYCGHSSS